ncbi:competence protein [Alkalihalobacterium elongatum]|nr:competence protein [Alkalihalobacterium elongatum]
MSKKSRSKREFQQGKDAVQPKNERYNNVTTMAEAENTTGNSKRDCHE